MAEIHFREFFSEHFAGIIFRELGFTKDFASINFRERDLYKDFSGINLSFDLKHFLYDLGLWFSE